ncbi:hypothetical protein VP1G_00339 [Cytospora mali]|uniref:Sterol uptake control protein 2 n=1 Tax=Cytospora mali TaxID=578113 RepID=A0A194UN64_CYTMA|nr:hypothetical protein VP1G_00339 [Valsa mali var. pyri (nom. inval.)]
MVENRNGALGISPAPSPSPLPSPSRPLQTTPKTFSMEDLHFFQHFLFQAYPPMPLGNELLWKDMAAMSHSFDFLVHAMLGAAASHLSLISSGDYVRQALAHRVASIQALNSALSKPAGSASEADARFATVFLLYHQSCYMPDGMYDFISMLRGCYLVADISGQTWSPSLELQSHQTEVTFRNAGDNDDAHTLLDRTYVEGFLDSMQRLAPLCTTTEEVKYHTAIINAVKRAALSAVDAYIELGGLYILLGSASASEFHVFADPSNHVGQLLLAHFFLIECVVQASVLKPIKGSTPRRWDVTAIWVKVIAQTLPVEYREYIRWPMDVAEMMLLDDEWLLPKGTQMDIPEDWKTLLLLNSHRCSGLRHQWKLMTEKAEGRGLITHDGSKPNIAIARSEHSEAVDCMDPTLLL